MGARSGTTDSFIGKYRDYLRRLARWRLGSRLRGKVDESDIVQEAILQAHLARDQFRGASEPERKVWLRTILESQVAGALASVLAATPGRGPGDLARTAVAGFSGAAVRQRAASHDPQPEGRAGRGTRETGGGARRIARRPAKGCGDAPPGRAFIRRDRGADGAKQDVGGGARIPRREGTAGEACRFRHGGTTMTDAEQRTVERESLMYDRLIACLEQGSEAREALRAPIEADFPEFAQELREFFDGQDILERMRGALAPRGVLGFEHGLG